MAPDGNRKRSDRILRSFLLQVHEWTKPPRPLAGVRSGGNGDPDREDWGCTPDRRVRHFGERIDFATARSREEGVGEIAFFHVADVLKAEIREDSYDVVLAEGALHHFTPLHAVYDKIFRALNEGGYLVINDFVGPTRFQWTDRQLDAANSILRALPARYRTRRDGTPKPAIFRPSRLSMIVGDPSEAVDSSGIMSKVRKRFEVVEERGYGGAILHILLAGIAHNFLGQDSQTESILQAIFAFEDALMSSGEIGSDYVFAVLRPREPQT